MYIMCVFGGLGNVRGVVCMCVSLCSIHDMYVGLGSVVYVMFMCLSIGSVICQDLYSACCVFV